MYVLRVGGRGCRGYLQTKPFFKFILTPLHLCRFPQYLLAFWLFIFVLFTDDSLESQYCIVLSVYFIRHLSILFLINSTMYIAPFYFGSVFIVIEYSSKNV